MAVDKLVDSTILNACCTAEANAIRAKTGGSAQIAYDWANSKGFADAIAAISGGSVGGVTWTEKTVASTFANAKTAAERLFGTSGYAANKMRVAILINKTTGSFLTDQCISRTAGNGTTTGGGIRWRSSAIAGFGSGASSYECYAAVGDTFIIADVSYA